LDGGLVAPRWPNLRSKVNGSSRFILAKTGDLGQHLTGGWVLD
jgi:hypothetical protein